MNIELLAAGTKPPDWITHGLNEYTKRLPKDWQLRVNEIKVARRSKTTSLENLKQEEGERMLAALRPSTKYIALDSRGDIWSTETLADNIVNWREEFSSAQMMIGGPDGLDQRCLDRANAVWSLSNLTFPHFMVRLVVAEQIYRAYAIINNHPYHK